MRFGFLRLSNIQTWSNIKRYFLKILLVCSKFTDSSLVMEWADKGDIYQSILKAKDKNSYFEETEVWWVFIQIIKGVQFLHSHQIIHWDLKCANFYEFSNGTIKIGDLNVSRVLKQKMIMTWTGTPFYTSPEIWKGKPYDYKSDMWSLGVSLYEMCTLNPPFDCEDISILNSMVLKGKFKPIGSFYSWDLSQVINSLI